MKSVWEFEPNSYARKQFGLDDEFYRVRCRDSFEAVRRILSGKIDRGILHTLVLPNEERMSLGDHSIGTVRKAGLFPNRKLLKGHRLKRIRIPVPQ